MRFLFLLFAAFALTGCASNNDLFLTSSTNDNKNSDNVFLGQYFTHVASTIYVSYDPGGSGKPKTLTISTSSFPTNMRYLYLHKSPLLYSDSGAIGTTIFGLLSSTDAQSQQDLTGVLGEVAKTTAGAAARYAAKLTFCATNPWSTSLQAERLEGDNLVRNGAVIHIETANIAAKLPASDPCDGEKDFDGFCVYEPSPIEVSVKCGEAILGPPTLVNIYKYRRVENPARDFFTAPHESFSLQDGVIIGHKYSSQSQIKGFFDFLTTPVRSALPQSAVQTQVQTGGGKPDQFTTTTTYTSNPSAGIP